MSSLPKVLALLTIVLAFGYGPMASCQTFTNPLRVATPVDPDSVVTGDLNEDGRVDLIWFNVTSTNSIGHVLLAQPNGGYLDTGAQFTIPGAQDGVPACATADVTKDGKIDLVCATFSSVNYSTTVVVFPGNGDGSFSAPTSTVFGNQYQGIILTAVGDLNADGVPDFILEDDYYSPAIVLLSDGKGGFLPAKTVPNSYNFSTPVVADINGDGIPDILWPEGAGVALGKGDGSFGDLISPLPPANGPVTCAFGDMDGDGKLDAVCGYIPSNIDDGGFAMNILHGNGDGTFNPNPTAHQSFGNPSIYASGSGDFQTPILIRDLNGDGIPDVLALAGDGLTVLLGQPGLTFSAPSHYAPAFSGFAFSSQVSAQTVYTDLNGDGLIDVLDAGPNGLYLLYGHADGSFGSAVATKVSEVTGHIAVADFNGDGKPDIVSTGAPGTSISLGNGDGTFAAPASVPGAPFAAAAQIYVADFNGDSKQDLLSSDPSLAYYLMLGKGDGTFAPAVAATGLPTAIASQNFTTDYTVSYAIAADLNADGKADLFSITTDAVTATYSLVSSLSAGDGTFRTVATSFPGIPLTSSGFYLLPLAPVLADFAHRERLDVAYLVDESLYVVQGNGDGSFSTTPLVLATPTVAGVQADTFEALQVADFDGDGNLDIAFLSWYEPGTYFYQGGPSCVFIYYGNGDGTFASPTQAGCFTHAYTDLRVGDFNGDGRPDIVLQTASALNNYVVGIIDNLGGRTFGPEMNYTAGSISGDIFVTDLNGDGRPDLVFGNQQYYSGSSSNSVTVLLNQSSRVATGALTSTPNPSYVGQAFTLQATLTPPFAGTVYTGQITFYVDGNVIGSTALSGNAATIAAPTTLAAGTHQLFATWPGDAADPALTFSATHTVLPYPLQIALTCSPNPSIVGQSVSLSTEFTAAPPAGMPASSAPYSGTLSFYDGVALLEQQQVATAGFSYATSTLSGGAHTLSASYSGDSVYAAATASCSEAVDKLPTMSQVSLNLVPDAGMAFQLVGKVASTSATTLSPTGTVSFTIDGASAGMGTLDSATGMATYSDPGIAGGNHTFACTYSGDANFAVSACPANPITVAPAQGALTLTSSANPAAAGSTVLFTANLSLNNKPAPGNAIAFTVSAKGVTQDQGSATTDANGNAVYRSPVLSPGNYTVSASFAGNASLQSAFAPLLTQLVDINPTATSLTATPEPGYAGSGIRLSATVVPTGSLSSMAPAPSGTVSFLDGTTVLGSAPLNASGVATLTTTSLGPGVHSLTASYPANTLFLASTSPPYAETVLAGTFTMALSPSQVTVAAGQPGVASIRFASVDMFAGPLTLTYGTPPASATVAISPQAVTLTSGGSATATLTVNTLAVTEAVPAHPGFKHRILAISTAGILLLPLISRRRRFAKLLLLAAALIVTQGLTGCGDVSYTAHTYTMPVTATDAYGNKQTANLTVLVAR